MGLMTRMRDHAHIFIIAFAVIFIAFWVVSDVDVGSVLQGSANEIGVIDGQSITYQEFSNVLEQVIQNQRTQMGDKELEENQIAAIREQVWNDYIQRAVIERAVNELGITVADREITDWVRSDNPPEVIAQHFRDSTGNFNRELYQQFLSNPGPENEQALVQIEEQLRSELLSQKLTTAITGSVQISDGELFEIFRAQNQQFGVDFILFDPVQLGIRDTMPPTQKEYEEYYNKNKFQFKNDDMVKLQFVSFAEVPSHDDTMAVWNELESLAQEAREGKDFLKLIEEHSEQPYQENWFTLGQVPPDQAGTLMSMPVGSIVGPFKDYSGILVIKILGLRDGKETFVRARHVLIRPEKGDDAARSEATDIYTRARAGEDFAALAQQYSDDEGSAQRGGDLGYFNRGRMVKAFEEACFNNPVGDIVGPLKSDFGYHVIKIEDRGNKELNYATLRMSVKPSPTTRDMAYENARNFAYFVSENGFEQEAQTNNYDIRETGDFAKQRGSYIPEIGVNPSLLKWAFSGSVGEFSDVYRSMNGYVVCKIASKTPAGYRPLEEVKKTIVANVLEERVIEKAGEIAKQFHSKLDPVRGIRSLLPADSSLRLLTAESFNFQQGVPVIGRDARFMGRVASLKPGEISKPFRGDRTYFIAQLLNKSQVDTAAFRLQKEELRRQQLQQKQSEYVQAWLEKMKERISITDNRDRFFR